MGKAIGKSSERINTPLGDGGITTSKRLDGIGEYYFSQ
jgi:hypothetical protein